MTLPEGCYLRYHRFRMMDKVGRIDNRMLYTQTMHNMNKIRDIILVLNMITCLL